MRRRDWRLLQGAICAIISPARQNSLYNHDIYTILPSDLDDAEQEFRSCEEAWRRNGAFCVDKREVEQTLQKAELLQTDLKQAKSESRPGLRLRYLHCVRLFVLTRLPSFGRKFVTCAATAGVCGISMLVAPFFFSSIGTAFLGAGMIFIVVAAILNALIHTLWPTDAKLQAFQRLEQQLRIARQRLATLRPIVDAAWDNYETLRSRWSLCDRLADARQRRDELVALLTSEKYKLIHTDWRSLRGIPFEEFLCRVFQLLGYAVEMTKASGDQGVDLVVTGNGRRIAVQAKGYADSAGNQAVKDVVAGTLFYRCDCCVAITNARFTSSAIELARVNNCLLIDGSRIPDLIEGQIL